jgi:hypothetical protein
MRREIHGSESIVVSETFRYNMFKGCSDRAKAYVHIMRVRGDYNCVFSGQFAVLDVTNTSEIAPGSVLAVSAKCEELRFMLGNCNGAQIEIAISNEVKNLYIYAEDVDIVLSVGYSGSVENMYHMSKGGVISRIVRGSIEKERELRNVYDKAICVTQECSKW